jgi:cell division protein FtsB
MDKSVSPITKFILIAEFVLAIYMLIALTTSQYNSYRIEKYIQEFEAQNQKLVTENNDLQDKYEYYTSPEYQEKIAKQNFGLINPGEQVLIIPESSVLSDAEEFQNKVLEERVLFYQSLNTPLKWWYFFFSRY